MCSAMLARDAAINYAFILKIIIVDEMWITLFNLETKTHPLK
jgi:hypothetical protein